MSNNSCYPDDANVNQTVHMDSFFTTTTTQKAGHVAKFLTPKETFPCTDPCLIEDWECYRTVHDYVIKSKQYLESSGVIQIYEPNKLLLQKVVVSGPTKMMDITHSFKNALLYKYPNMDPSCPIDGFDFDTGMINYYSGGDVECGYRKIIQFTYMTDDAKYEQKKLRRIELDDTTYERSFDPTACDENGNPINTGLPYNMDTDPSWDVIKHSMTYKINNGRCCDSASSKHGIVTTVDTNIKPPCSD
jgi:hypothetical protein